MKKQEYYLETLSSGLKVLRVPYEVKSVFSLVLANTGARYEEVKNYGIAHFFEHMVFKGTQRYPTAKDIAVRIDGLGAEFNAFTGDEYTGYYIKAASRHVDIAWEMLSEMLLQPILAEEEIEKERGVILEERRMYIDNPQSHISNKFSEMFYKGSGLEHNIVGNEQTIKNIGKKDLERFLSKWYELSNLLLVVAGDKHILNNSNFLGRIDQFFSVNSKIKRETAPAREKYLEKDFKYGDKLHIEYRETQQAHFVLGWPGLKISDDRRFAATLLRVILGGNMSSRLFTEVREKRGLCYYVGATMENNLDSGCFGARAGVNLDKIEEALEATMAEFGKITEGAEGITEEELTRAKEFVTGQTILGMESLDGVAEGMGFDYLLRGEILTPQEKLAKLAMVKKEEVVGLARELFKRGEMRLAVIGPYPNADIFTAMLA